MKYILIMWVMNHSAHYSQGGITAEFDSYEACNKAWVTMHENIRKSGVPFGTPAIAGGCFKK